MTPVIICADCIRSQKHSDRRRPGYYDVQYAGREIADCRGRLHSDKDGHYGYRAVVPVAYPIPGDVSHPKPSGFVFVGHRD